MWVSLVARWKESRAVEESVEKNTSPGIEDASSG
jgi:hypothetical protein